MFLEVLFWKNAREAESLRNNYQWKARSLANPNPCPDHDPNHTLC